MWSLLQAVLKNQSTLRGPNSRDISEALYTFTATLLPRGISNSIQVFQAGLTMIIIQTGEWTNDQSATFGDAWQRFSPEYELKWTCYF